MRKQTPKPGRLGHAHARPKLERGLRVRLPSSCTSTEGLAAARATRLLYVGTDVGTVTGTAPKGACLLDVWRRGWDSNPRYGYPYA